jgi:two-component system, chemotaxis family, protein-glutamate methylesterase/glutaminase
MSKFEVVVIGASAGGLSALERILEKLNPGLKAGIVICQHMASDTGDAMLQLLKKHSVLEINEPLDKEEICSE